MTTNQCPPENDTHPSDCQILEGYRTRSRERASAQNDEKNSVIYTKAEPVRLLLLDVDGVLTDGSLYYTEGGEEAKRFNTQDGLGIRLAQKAGVEVGLITARTSKIVSRRAEELGMQHIYQGATKKLDAYKQILKKTSLKPFQVCYMGDDWIDLALLTRTGLAACPANSVPEVMEVCHFISSKLGGSGAVREVCDLLLRAKGLHEKILQYYLA